jgi:hypothetical protein
MQVPDYLALLINDHPDHPVTKALLSKLGIVPDEYTTPRIRAAFESSPTTSTRRPVNRSSHISVEVYFCYTEYGRINCSRRVDVTGTVDVPFRCFADGEDAVRDYLHDEYTSAVADDTESGETEIDWDDDMAVNETENYELLSYELDAAMEEYESETEPDPE